MDQPVKEISRVVKAIQEIQPDFQFGNREEAKDAAENESALNTESDIFADANDQPAIEIGSSINDDWTDRPYTTGDMRED